MRHALALNVALGSLIAACSANSGSPGGGSTGSDTQANQPNANGDGTGGGGDTSGSGGGGVTGNGPAIHSGGGSPGTGGGGPAGPACQSSSQQGEAIPLDIFVMMDQSKSMEETGSGGVSKWTAVTSAVKTFVDSPASAGIGIGIQYFGLKGAATTGGSTTPTPSPWPGGGGGGIGFGGFTSSCNAADYAVPEVPIASLPGNASKIDASLAAHSPTTATPTVPALQGAVNYAKDWQTKHPSHTTVVILATDGEPNECSSTVAGVANVAATALSAKPSVKTFVIGVGSSLSSLDAIAQAGGSTKSYNVDTGGDVAKQFSDALNAIRGTALPCAYVIPTGGDAGALDFNAVNVNLTPSMGSNANKAQGLLQATGSSECDAKNGGWFYDDPSAPTQIKLCDASCKIVTSDSKAKVSFSIGCKTQTIIPH